MENMEDEVVETRPERKNVQLSVPTKLLNILLSLAAVAMTIIYKLIVNFGGYSPVLHGIFSLVVYALAFGGVVFVFMKEQKLSHEWWFNVVVLALALMVI